jgi:hypothetical protein
MNRNKLYFVLSFFFLLNTSYTGTKTLLKNYLFGFRIEKGGYSTGILICNGFFHEDRHNFDTKFMGYNGVKSYSLNYGTVERLGNYLLLKTDYRFKEENTALFKMEIKDTKHKDSILFKEDYVLTEPITLIINEKDTIWDLHKYTLNSTYFHNKGVGYDSFQIIQKRRKEFVTSTNKIWRLEFRVENENGYRQIIDLDTFSYKKITLEPYFYLFAELKHHNNTTIIPISILRKEDQSKQKIYSHISGGWVTAKMGRRHKTEVDCNCFDYGFFVPYTYQYETHKKPRLENFRPYKSKLKWFR